MSPALNGLKDSSLTPSALERDPRWHLVARIAASPLLSRSDQMREILFFLVRQTLLHPDEPIRETDIAYKVLRRPASFNPVDDNIVRVQVAHLRKRLAQYFSDSGKDEKTIISVARGSYRIIFSSRIAFPPEQDSDSSVALAVPENPAVQLSDAAGAHEPTIPFRSTVTVSGKLWGAMIVVGCALLLIVISLSINMIRDHRRIEALQRSLAPWRSTPSLSVFWASFFDSPHEVDLVLSDNSLLLNEQITHLLPSYNAYINRNFPSAEQTHALSPEVQQTVNIIGSKGLGSVSEFKAAQKIQLLEPGNGRLRFFGARQFPSAFLEQNNVILIGGMLANPWEGIFDEKLNFGQITRFVDTGHSYVENRAPQPGEPKNYLTSDNVGYCVIAYLPQYSRGTSVLIVEGTGSEATEAASDFLSSEEQMAGLLHRFHAKSFPPFEVLLKINQLRGTPLSATVEAYRIYPLSH